MVALAVEAGGGELRLTRCHLRLEGAQALPRFVTLANNIQEPLLACPELGSQLIGARLPLICPQRRTRELCIQVLDIAFVDRPVRFAIVQRLDAGRELRSQHLALCNEALGSVRFVLRAVRQLGVSVALRLDGALGIPFANLGLAKAILELSKLTRRTLSVRHESVVRPLQRLESFGALFDQRGGGGACRAVLRFSGTR